MSRQIEPKESENIHDAINESRSCSREQGACVLLEFKGFESGCKRDSALTCREFPLSAKMRRGIDLGGMHVPILEGCEARRGMFARGRIGSDSKGLRASR